MEKLYEHTLRKQEARHKAEMEAQKEEMMSTLNARMEAKFKQLKACEDGEDCMVPATSASSSSVMSSSKQLTVNQIDKSVKTTNIDQSVGKTVNSITINIFGKENLDRVTKPQIFNILRALGSVDEDGENLSVMAEKAVLQTALLIFSDPTYPEDITCYLPNKKGSNALIHGAMGWEVQPVGLVISPMAAQSIEALFKYQPTLLPDSSKADYDWITEECRRIMRYIADHEKHMCNGPPKGGMRGVLIRNKELLQQVLRKLPAAGTA